MYFHRETRRNCDRSAFASAIIRDVETRCKEEYASEAHFSWVRRNLIPSSPLSMRVWYAGKEKANGQSAATTRFPASAHRTGGDRMRPEIPIAGTSVRRLSSDAATGPHLC